MTEKLLLTVDECAERLAVGRTVVYQWISHGDLVSLKLGRSRRIPVSELDRFVERLQAEAV